MKTPKHSWVAQPGFRIFKCEHCGAIHFWDEGYQNMRYKKDEFSPSVRFAPSCKFIMITDVPIKM